MTGGGSAGSPDRRTIVADIGLVGLTNGVCQVGIAQQAVADAPRHPMLTPTSPAPRPSGRSARTSSSSSWPPTRVPRADGGWSVLVDASTSSA